MLAEHGIPDADIDSSDLAMKTVELSKPGADGATRAHTVARHYVVQVRDLARWPALVTSMLAREHVDSLSASFGAVRGKADPKRLRLPHVRPRASFAATTTKTPRH